MKLGKVVLVGHSFGGRIASHIASLYPEDILRLVVISPSGVNHSKWWYPLVGRIPKRLKSVFRPLAVRMEDKDVRQAGKLRLMIKNILKEDFEPVFKRINAPTLIIWGKNDFELPSSDGYKIKRLIEKSTLKIIPGSHFSFVDNPKLVASLINSFIR